MMDPGLIVAPLTPFTTDLEVDTPALRRQIDYVVEDCGATMVVAAGVETQEYTYLSLEKRKALIRTFEKRVFEQAYQEPLLWWHRIVPSHKVVMGWKMSPSHNLGADLGEVLLDQ